MLSRGFIIFRCGEFLTVLTFLVKKKYNETFQGVCVCMYVGMYVCMYGFFVFCFLFFFCEHAKKNR